jgi:hypothetical protein
VSRKRAILDNAVEYAVELGHLSGNPISSTKWRAPKPTEAVNPRVVINHGQARALLAAVGKQESGRALVAFFGSCTTRPFGPVKPSTFGRRHCHSRRRGGASCT